MKDFHEKTIRKGDKVRLIKQLNPDEYYRLCDDGYRATRLLSVQQVGNDFIKVSGFKITKEELKQKNVKVFLVFDKNISNEEIDI